MLRPYFLAFLFVAFWFENSSSQLPPSEDDFIKAFLNATLQNYTSYTNGRLPPMPDLVKLQAANETDGVDLDVEIKNHVMSGYFDTSSDSYEPMSIFSAKTLVAIRRVTNEPFTFTGNYTATGLLHVSETLNVSFSGQGNWTLKTVNTNETLAYVDYKIVGEEYIALLESNVTAWAFVADWQPFELTGITFNYEGEEDPSWKQQVSQAFVKLYQKFLNRIDEPDEAPPRKLLHIFLMNRFVTTKLSDIIPGWGVTTTTTPRTPPTPPPPSKGSTLVFNFLLSFVLIVVTSMSKLILK